jgi:NOL1/NOP2/fmu family ribosome biogenesis protein
MTKKKSYKIFENICNVDISEQDIYDYSPEVLAALLEDHTMSIYVQENSKEPSKVANIFWATFDYESTIIDENGIVINDGYQYNDEIKIEKITGLCQRVIMPRVLKTKQLQIDRTKDKAEVFTPSWVCNAQNNLIDTAWFGRKDVFNREVISENGTHYWIPTEGKIVFPDNDPKKTWTKYIVENRMEITCGEAPYLVSRYDTTTGVFIPIQKRIGLLDRKFRVINENVKTEKEWYDMAEKYGYEVEEKEFYIPYQEAMKRSKARKAEGGAKRRVPKARRKVFASLQGAELAEVSRWVDDAKAMSFRKIDNVVYGYDSAVMDDVTHLSESLSVAYSGVALGQIFKGALKPEHSLAMFVGRSRDVVPEVEVSLEDAQNFLRKQDIDAKQFSEGINIVMYKGVAIGFVKRIGARCNNMYPKEQRILNL